MFSPTKPVAIVHNKVKATGFSRTNSLPMNPKLAADLGGASDYIPGRDFVGWAKRSVPNILTSCWARYALPNLRKKAAPVHSVQFGRKFGDCGLSRLREKGVIALGVVLLFFTALTVTSPAWAAGEASIAVVYPDIGEPYRTVFAQIIGGIEDRTKMQVGKYAVGQNVDIAELKNTLRSQDVKVVIALGRQGMKIAATLDRNIGVVVGGVITPPENEMRDLPVNSLSPDPALLFSHLKRLVPAARRVFTVYDPRQNAWMLRLAKEAARAQGLELMVYEAQDLRGAMHAYQEIFAAADSRRDALWLLQDSTTVEDGSVLPLVLNESWAHNLAVFSSSFGHVRRGVLFSLYPDNAGLGRHLADTALGFLASGDYGEHGMILLREVLMAVNLRTAKHLGLNTSLTQSFDMAFPEQ